MSGCLICMLYIAPQVSVFVLCFGTSKASKLSSKLSTCKQFHQNTALSEPILRQHLYFSTSKASKVSSVGSAKMRHILEKVVHANTSVKSLLWHGSVVQRRIHPLRICVCIHVCIYVYYTYIYTHIYISKMLHTFNHSSTWPLVTTYMSCLASLKSTMISGSISSP